MPLVDKTYPSQIAAERPALKTRIHCPDSEDAPDLRGGEHDEHSSSAVETFNRRLRSGHSQRERDE